MLPLFLFQICSVILYCFFLPAHILRLIYSKIAHMFSKLYDKLSTWNPCRSVLLPVVSVGIPSRCLVFSCIWLVWFVHFPWISIYGNLWDLWLQGALPKNICFYFFCICQATGALPGSNHLKLNSWLVECETTQVVWVQVTNLCKGWLMVPNSQ